MPSKTSALGYVSWAEYSKAEFGEETRGLAPEFRRQLVGILSAEGMSTRAIAPAVGVGSTTVKRDIHAANEVVHNGPPAKSPAEVTTWLSPEQSPVAPSSFPSGFAAFEAERDTGEVTTRLSPEQSR